VAKPNPHILKCGSPEKREAPRWQKSCSEPSIPWPSASDVEKRREDNPTFASYYPQDDTNRVVYNEGIFVGYRGYEHNKTQPLFPFGFGLSYTAFKFSN